MAQESTPPGIIDTLSAGFGKINRILWILLIPVLLDLFLWQGPRLSAAPVARQALDWYSSQVAVMSPAAGSTLPGQEQVRQGLEEAVSSFNLFSILALNIASVPSYMVEQTISRPAAAEVRTTLDFVLMVMALGLGGLLLGAGYLGFIAQQIRGDETNGWALLSRVMHYWLNIAGAVLAIIMMGLLIAFPISAVLTLALLVSQSLGGALLLLIGAGLQVGFFAALIYLFFWVDAIVVSGVGPLRAARNSMMVVNRNFWPAVGLMLLSFIILAGTRIVWELLANQSMGLVPGILGNAYIASGLSAASMLFYRDRLAILERKKHGGTEIESNKSS